MTETPRASDPVLAQNCCQSRTDLAFFFFSPGVEEAFHSVCPRRVLPFFFFSAAAFVHCCHLRTDLAFFPLVWRRPSTVCAPLVCFFFFFPSAAASVHIQFRQQPCAWTLFLCMCLFLCVQGTVPSFSPFSSPSSCPTLGGCRSADRIGWVVHLHCSTRLLCGVRCPSSFSVFLADVFHRRACGMA